MKYFFNAKALIYIFIILTIKISLIKSEEDKCYTIENCEKCPQLDFCDKCSAGFKINKSKTKCKGKIKKSKKINKHKKLKKKVDNKPLNSKKSDPSSQKPQVDHLKNKPFTSTQKAKQEELNRAKINAILLIILAILVITIIISNLYELVKKCIGTKKNGHIEDYMQEENIKVVVN